MGTWVKTVYGEDEIERIKNILETNASMGNPFEFEIVVDDFKAINRTTNVEALELFNNFIKPYTKNITIKLYHGKSRNCDIYVLQIPDAGSMPGGLAGLGNLDAPEFNKKMLQTEKLKWDYDLLKKEYEKTLEKLQDAEDTIEELEKTKNTIYGLDPGPLLAAVATNYMAQNPGVIKKIGLGALLPDSSPALPEHNGSQGEQDQGAKAGKAMSESEKAWLSWVNEEIASCFSSDEFNKLVAIIKECQQDKDLLDEIIDFCHDEEGSEESEISAGGQYNNN